MYADCMYAKKRKQNKTQPKRLVFSQQKSSEVITHVEHDTHKHTHTEGSKDASQTVKLTTDLLASRGQMLYWTSCYVFLTLLQSIK